MDAEQRQKVCQLIAGIVITDEDLDPKEEAFIEKLLDKFGLEATERDVIFPLVDAEEAATTMKELSAEAQAEAFDLLIQAAAADGKVVEEEQAYLRKVGEVVGVGEEEIETRLVDALAES